MATDSMNLVPSTTLTTGIGSNGMPQTSLTLKAPAVGLSAGSGTSVPMTNGQLVVGTLKVAGTAAGAGLLTGAIMIGAMKLGEVLWGLTGSGKKTAQLRAEKEEIAAAEHKALLDLVRANKNNPEVILSSHRTGIAMADALREMPVNVTIESHADMSPVAELAKSMGEMGRASLAGRAEFKAQMDELRAKLAALEGQMVAAPDEGEADEADAVAANAFPAASIPAPKTENKKAKGSKAAPRVG